MKNNLWNNLFPNNNYNCNEIYIFLKNYTQILSGIGSLPEVFNSSLLHLAARSGDAGLLEKVLNCENVDINLQDENGWTALHISAFLGYTEMFKFLVDKGANIHIKTFETSDYNAVTPYDIVVPNLHLEMTILCIDKGYEFIDISPPGRNCGNRTHKDYLEKLFSHYNNSEKISKAILKAIKLYNSVAESESINLDDLHIESLHIENMDSLGNIDKNED